MELIWEHRELLGILPYIAALYDQNSCATVFTVLRLRIGNSRILAARAPFQSPHWMLFQGSAHSSLHLAFQLCLHFHSLHCVSV